MSTSDNLEAIAIVGMALRVPGADDPRQFWKNVVAGTESVQRYGESELLEAGVPRFQASASDYVPAGAPLQNMDHFDAEFFGLGPSEAAVMDPQHRQFLECAWEALERAGHAPSRFDGAVGVFAGCGQSAYYAQNILTNPELVENTGLFLLRHTGNDKDFLTTRLSYILNLNGPSIAVQTACSTSLVAVHLAAQSLLSGECDLALAGGVTIELPHRHGYVYRESEILSPDGHCRPFDREARGTIFGSGVGVVALRRLEDALASGDEIVAVIRGSAVNNDGAGKAGYLAPSVDGQAAAISEAFAVASVEPGDVEYVECHGTGTAMGDPIEVAALTQAFRESAQQVGFCALGSVKANIGHLDTAAGVVGLIKAALSLQHETIPPSINYTKANPELRLETSPFYIPTEARKWARRGGTRYASVNSLGVGGTNAHVVLQQAPPKADSSTTISKGPWLLTWSGKTQHTRAYGEKLSAHLQQHPDVSLDDVAHTLRERRGSFTWWAVAGVASRQHAIEVLSEEGAPNVFVERRLENPDVVFMYPGGGAPYLGMGRRTYHAEPTYQQWVDRGLQSLKDLTGIDGAPYLFTEDTDSDELKEQLHHPSLQLPLLYIVEYALTQLWLARGIHPSFLVGHSLGENTASAVASVVSFEDGLALVRRRGELFERVSPGGLLSVPLAGDALSGYLSPELDLACENGAELSVASGPNAALDALEERLARDGIEGRRVKIGIAAHSKMLEPILQEFEDFLCGIQLRPPRIPIVSNRSGKVLTDEEATSPRYWVSHLRHTVRFADDIRFLSAQEDRVFLEVGPGATLSKLMRSGLSRSARNAVIQSLPTDSQGSIEPTYVAAGRLWCAGVNGALPQAEVRGRLIDLPTYAFHHKRYWIEPGAGAKATERRLDDISQWFYTDRWSLHPANEGHNRRAETKKRTYLVFCDQWGVGDAVLAKLRRQGHTAVAVRRAAGFGQPDSFEYNLPPSAAVGYETLLQELRSSERVPDHILHLWLLDADTAKTAEELGFFSLLRFFQALSAEGVASPMHLSLVTRQLHSLTGEGVRVAEQALALGPLWVGPREFPTVVTCNVDLEEISRRGWASQREAAAAEADALLKELETRDGGSVALRGGARYRRELERLDVGAATQEATPGASLLRHGGVYLITGGLGGIGAVLAEHLATQHQCRLVLTSRQGPPESTSEAEQDSPTRSRVALIRRLESLGAKVQLHAADVADPASMETVVTAALARFGRIDGIFHAAGLVHDRLMATKTRAEVLQVLRAKVEGTRVLEALLPRCKANLFVLFSSSSTVSGPIGQADYVAANEYLNARAAALNQRANLTALAVDWGVWRDVGMAVAAASGIDNDTIETTTSTGMFSRRVNKVDGSVAFESTLSPRETWWLDQHRTSSGLAVVAGTAWLQLLAAAARELQLERFELMDVVFERPLAFPEDSSRSVSVELHPTGGAYLLQAYAGTDGGSKNDQRYLSAQLMEGVDESPEPLDLPTLLEECDAQQASSEALPSLQDEHLRFGEQWQVLRRSAFRDGHGIAELKLEHAERSPLHPGLLDIATSFGVSLIKGFDPGAGLWVPMSYGALRIYAPLPAHVFSRCRLRDTESIGSDTATFDVTVCDVEGRVLLEVDEFTVRRVEESADFGRSPAAEPKGQGKPATHSEAQTALERNIADGITPKEGMLALETLLRMHAPARTIVSPVPVARLVQEMDELTRPKEQSKTGYERPELATHFVPPKNEVQAALVAVWERLLGISGIGIDDDFFDLGGHSLLALRMLAEVKKTYGVALTLGDLVETNSVAKLSQLVPDIAEQRSEGSAIPAASKRWTPIVPLKRTGRKKPWFCVAGMGGNPVHLRTLCRFIDKERPVFGLRHRGADGTGEPYASVEEMAADYVAAIREIDPEGPYLLGGYSGGGTAAIAMANLLARQAGTPVASVILLDSFRPNARRALDLKDRLEVHRQSLAEEGYRYVLRRLAQRADLVARKLRQTRAPEREPTLFERAAANWRAIETKYEPPPVAVDGCLFRVRPADLAEAKAYDQRYEGWSDIITGQFEEFIVPGTHVTMCEEPNVRILARKLCRALDAADHRDGGAHGRQPRRRHAVHQRR